MATKNPPKLSLGDIIGIAAPASPFKIEDFERGLEIIESAGFNALIPEGLFEKTGYHAGTAKHRAKILHQLFENPEVKAIICARGGFGSMKILPYLNFDLIRQNPKIFIGFSDITALLCAIYERSGFATFHGPLITTLTDHESIQSFLSALISEKVPLVEACSAEVIRAGKAEAPLIGGNLTTLCHLLGTSFMPLFYGHILFLEDRGEAVYRIDRMLTQMNLAGCFEGIQGLALGSFTDCGDTAEIYALFKKIFKAPIPILAGFECGHCAPNKTIAIGLNATLDTNLPGLLFL